MKKIKKIILKYGNKSLIALYRDARYFIFDKEYFGFRKKRESYHHTGLFLRDLFRWIMLFLLLGASAEDYFMYDFSNKRFNEINTFITLRRRRLVTEYLNRPGQRDLVEDKVLFETRFRRYLLRDTLGTDSFSKEVFTDFVLKHGKVIAKPRYGYDGKNILVVRSDDDLDHIYEIIKNGYVIEQFLTQTGILSDLNPGTCNTLRINVFNSGYNSEVFNAVLRMGRGNGGVDNFHKGGIIALIDVETGKVITNGIDINGNSFDKHPDSHVEFYGMIIPNWKKAKSISCKAARELGDVPYSSWDIAIVGDDVAIIEGNTYGNTDVIQSIDQIGKWDYFKYMKRLIKEHRKNKWIENRQ